MKKHIKSYCYKIGFLLLLCSFAFTSVFAQSPQVFTTSGTFTVPVCVTSITVQCWGAGGGGGGGAEPNGGACGSGGGGGGFATTVINNASGTYTVTVGTGGTPGTGSTSTATSGTTGGNSSVTNGTVTVTATGGGGGTGNTSGVGSTVGAGGSAIFVGITGTTYTGGSGALGNNQHDNTGGAGGGGAGNAGNGTTPPQTGRDANATGGAGGTGNPNTAQYAGGMGGSVVADFYENGGNGTTIGGGGAGGGGETQIFNGTGPGNGGTGGNGQVIISYTVSTPTITTVTGSGCTGSTVTINGTLLSGATSVTINGTAVTNLSITATSITGTIAPGTTTGTVTVTTPCGTANSPTAFTVHTASTVNLGSQSSCTGSYTFGGHTYTTSGTYADTTASVITGCDSITTITLHIGTVVNQSISKTICSDTAINFGGHSINTTGTYVDTATSVNGCDSITTLNLTVNQSPVASVTPAALTLCGNTDTTLTATAGSGYLWSNGSTTRSILINPVSTTTYTVTVSSGAGCPGTASSTVNVSPFAITITPDSTNVCISAQVTLTCSYTSPNTSGYTWHPNVGNSQGVVVYPLNNTTYSVTVTNTANCTASASAIVTVDASFLTLTPDTTGVCAGQSATLTASGAAAYAWSTGSGASSITVSPTATTTYTVMGSDARGCFDTLSAVVLVGSMPTATFTVTPATLCVSQNGTVTYTGTSSNAAVYTWNFGTGIASGTGKGPYQVNWGTAGQQSISLAITDNGCIAVPDTVTVTVNPGPTANAGNDTTFCGSNSVLIGTTSTTGYTYLWSPVAGLSSATVANPTVTLTNTTSSPVLQTYVVTTTGLGCQSTDTVVLTIDPGPVAKFTHPTGQCYNANGNVFNLTAGGSFLPSSATFAWTFGGNAVPTSSTTATQAITLLGPQTAPITLTISQAGCVNAYTDSAIVYPIPVAAFSSAATTGCPGLNVCFTNNTISVGTTSYQWAFGDGQTSTLQAPCHVYADSGSYTVNLRVSANGCPNDTTINNFVLINPAPTAKFAASATTLLLPDGEVEFTNLSSSATNYSWNFGGLSTSTDISPIYNFTQYGLYDVVLQAYNPFGCSDSTTQAIKILAPQNYFIPNVFTPNNDGNNDKFFIEMQEGVTVLEFSVFDRTGEKVYDGLFPWDGTFKGKPCPNGVYVYTCKLQLATNTVGIKRTGTVTLMR